MIRLGGTRVAAWWLVTTAGSALAQAPAELTLVFPTERQSIAIVRSSADQREMVRLADLADIFDLDVQDETRPNTVTVAHDGAVMILTAGQPVVSVAGQLVSLRTSAPRRAGDDWLVPLELMSRALGRLVDETIMLRERSYLALVGNVVVPTISARFQPRGSNAQVDIDVRPSAPHTITQEKGRLVLQFDADGLDVGRLPALRGDVVTGISVDSDTERVIIELGSAFGSYNVATQSIRNGERLTIALGAARGLAPAPDVAAAGLGAEPPVSNVPLPDLRTAPEVRVVAIDAGHGGADEGTVGPADTREKNVTLSVARRLRDAIVQRLGLRVILTRARDESLALDARAAIANNNKADLFISLHVNASVRPSATGAEVFYLSMDGFEEARELADRDAQVVPVVGGGARAIGLVQWELAQVRYLDGSARLADIVHQELSRRIPMSPRNVQEAPFRVLVGANMPAVLVEMGFVSNARDEQRLTSARFQTAVVDALVGSILRYRDHVQATVRAATGDRSSLQARDDE